MVYNPEVKEPGNFVSRDIDIYDYQYNTSHEYLDYLLFATIEALKLAV